MHTASRTAAATAAGLLMLALAACGGPPDNTSAVPPGTGQVQNEEQLPEPAETFADLQGVSTQIALDEGFVDALATFGLSAEATGDATLVEDALTFPITGGDVQYFEHENEPPSLGGTVEHEGSGLTLTAAASGVAVELTELVFDGETSEIQGTATVGGLVVGENLTLFQLSIVTLDPLTTTEDGDTVLSGMTVLLSEGAATLLNQSFDSEVLTNGLLIGSAELTLRATPEP